MPTESSVFKRLLGIVAFLVGAVALGLLLWLVAMVAVASILFLALSLFTDWGFIAKLCSSVVASLIALKLVSGISESFGFPPEWWFDPIRRPTPCPHCGRPLRTARAQQCPHCGADWHSQQTQTH